MKSLSDKLYVSTSKALEIPQEPLDPKGEAVIRAFKPAPRYAGYRLVRWVFTQLGVFIPFALFLIPREVHHFFEQFGMDWIQYMDYNSQWQEKIPGPLQNPVKIILFGGYIVQLMFSFVATFLSAKSQAYLLSDRSLRIRRGLWIYKEITLSLKNIQQVKISQNILERLWGIGTVEVRTAGGGAVSKKDEKNNDKSHTGELVGLLDPFDMRELVNTAIENASSAAATTPSPNIGAGSYATAQSPELQQAIQELSLASKSLRHAIANQS